ncbi:DegV family protein [Spiroplasma endosymbiont of Clivina fossor]|uniref:DegV family protein n=1 Tax=Spiroplasma endosymbiont of Clivina fossor TaxID=3066282 RepID=UPI003CC7A082
MIFSIIIIHLYHIKIYLKLSIFNKYQEFSTKLKEFNGFIDKFDKTRTFKKAIKEVLKEIKKRYDSAGELTIMHSLCDTELKKEVIKIITKEKFTIKHMSLISNVIAAHTGYNTFVLVYWIK